MRGSTEFMTQGKKIPVMKHGLSTTGETEVKKNNFYTLIHIFCLIDISVVVSAQFLWPVYMFCNTALNFKT